MKTIRLAIINQWPDFDYQDNIFTYILSKEYNIIRDNQNPEYVITGNHNEYRYPNAIKIFWSGEPIQEKGNCDYALIQYDTNWKNFFRLPLYIYWVYDVMVRGQLSDGFDFFTKERTFYRDEIKNRKFCNWVCGGQYPGDNTKRDKLYKLINQYKHIDCAGSRFNNIPKLSGGSNTPCIRSIYKRDFISNYKFTIGFENQSTIENFHTIPEDGIYGYTTEKFIEPMLANSLLLYWGNKDIGNEFNKDSYINYSDYDNDESFINRIIEVDKDDDLYYHYMTQKYTTYNKYFDIDYLVSIMKQIFD